MTKILYSSRNQSCSFAVEIKDAKDMKKIFHKSILAFCRGISVSCLLIIPVFSSIQCSNAVADIPDDINPGISTANFILKSSSDATNKLKSLEVFVYMKDGKNSLDVYQKYEDVLLTDSIRVSSTYGDRIVVFLANHKTRDYKWSEVGRLANLKEMLIGLEGESFDYPVMTSIIDIPARSVVDYQIKLNPLTCKVILKSISCDFSSTNYPHEKMKNVRVYLTNVNADSRVDPSTATACRFINLGGFHSDDMDTFLTPQILCRNLLGEVGNSVRALDYEFLCYPNLSLEDSLGSAFTRLVIECEIDGKTWYYPINVASGLKMEAGAVYSYEVKIKRKGNSNPDDPISIDKLEINLNVVKWEEKDEYCLDY